MESFKVHLVQLVSPSPTRSELYRRRISGRVVAYTVSHSWCISYYRVLPLLLPTSSTDSKSFRALRPRLRRESPSHLSSLRVPKVVPVILISNETKNNKRRERTAQGAIWKSTSLGSLPEKYGPSSSISLVHSLKCARNSWRFTSTPFASLVGWCCKKRWKLGIILVVI